MERLFIIIAVILIIITLLHIIYVVATCDGDVVVGIGRMICMEDK